MKSVQRSNKQGRSKKRLSGDAEAQSKTAACLASFLRPREASALVEQPRMSQATVAVAKTVVKSIADSVGPDTMLDACDGAGVSQKGYMAIYKTLKNRIGLVAPGLTTSILPAPNRLASLRKHMNDKLPQFIGEYYHVEGRRVIPEVRQGNKVITRAKEVILDNKNNLFVDLEVVQRSMVMFYGMTVEGNPDNCT